MSSTGRLMRTDFDWQYHEGRDRDGEKLSDWVLVHGSGRVLAKIMCPLTPGEYHYQIYFFTGAAKEARQLVYDGDGDIRFMDLMSAQRFCEEALTSYSSTPLKTKKPRRAREQVSA